VTRRRVAPDPRPWVTDTEHVADGWWVIGLIVVTTIVINTLGYRAMKRGVVGKWFSPAVALATVLVLVGADFSLPLLVVGFLTLLVLGITGGVAIQRGRSVQDQP